MSTFSEAFAGFAKTFTGEDTTPQSLHGKFLHGEILPLTAKLQREIRGRRYKEEQTKLQEAILVLRSFQNEVWPPPQQSSSSDNRNKQQQQHKPTKERSQSTDSVPKNIIDDSSSNSNSSDAKKTPDREHSGESSSLQRGVEDDPLGEELDNDHDEGGGDTTVELEATSVSADSSSAVLVEHEDPLRSITDDDQNTVVEQREKASSKSSSSMVIDDDPLTREPMHKAIHLLLEALIKILHHPATNNACVLSLDCVTLLVKRGYVSGRAGGGGGAANANPNANTSSSTPAAVTPTKSPPNESTTPPPAEGGDATEAQAAADAKATNSASTQTLLHRLLESVAAASSETTAEVIQTAVLKSFLSIVTSPKCGVHEASMLLAFRSTFHVYLVTKSTHCKTAAKQALLDMLRAVFSRMEAYDAVAKSSCQGSKQQFPSPPQSPNPSTEGTVESSSVKSTGTSDGSTSGTMASFFLSQYHTDSYVLFRALCKLSSKELPVDNESEADSTRSAGLFNSKVPTTDPLALNSKILSLELILSAMDFCGDAFCHGERFIYLVQHYLCVSLLKNCMSSQTQVAFLSQKIFLVLVYKFKGHLKQEIEVFLSNIFLRVLDSPNSSFKQKALVLESLRSLCRDPSLLTQIFLNYDCDFDAMNLYKEIVHMLTKLGGKATIGALTPNASTTASKKDAEQDFELSLAGMEVLVTILKAMLRALGLPGGGSDEHDDKAGARIREMLQLDSGLAAAFLEVDPSKHDSTAAPSSSSAFGAAASAEGVGDIQDDFSIVDREQAGTSPPASTATTDTFPSDGAASSDVAGKIVDAFEMKRNAEQNFEIGAVKFTLSLKGGLKFFIDNGFVQCDSKEFALFFLANKDKLDKTQMGEALGREPDAAFLKEKSVEADKGGPGFWVRILHHYVDALDFTGLVFDEGIRLFLSGFRLPGEAQKIDRIMEKFAEKFTSQNPDVFPSADTAFILAFSVIMLNTDLHNPSIKPERRMTLESFLRNNRGIGENGGDLPNEMLEGIFNRIKERPFSLKEDDVAREREASNAQKQIFDTSLFFEGSSLFGTSAEQRKRETFKKEKDELMAVTEQLIRRRPEKNAKIMADPTSRLTDTVAPADVVKPMFDVTWGPMLGILSQVLECSDDERSVAVCLNGFVYAVRIASHSNMSLARDTFVSSLAKFTFLGSIKEMKKKNVESVRTLLSIAVIDGEYLDESWEPVLQCISQLARLRLTASGLDSDESFLGSSEGSKTKKAAPATSSSAIFSRPPSKGELARETNENNGKAVLEAVQEVLIDKVFSSTVNLSAKSLARFIEQLIDVSESEIGGGEQKATAGVDGGRSMMSSSHGQGGPSIYSLQRLVDVAFWNMDVRPRLVWAQVWEMMADFFAKIACHSNAMVSVFAIDSLKQLSLKFLEKPELSEFNFQRIFLHPFLIVMEEKESREDVRELVLQCVDTIIRTKSRNLRSGWKVVFSILDRSASDPSEKIDFLGLAILQRLLDEHLHEVCSLSDDGSSQEELSPRIRNANAEDFVELCRASISFIGKEETDSPRPMGLSMRAFCHTAIYADLLASKRVLPPVSGAQCSDPSGQGYTYKGLTDDESLEMALWRPLLEGLAEGVQSQVRNGVDGVGCLVQRGSVLALRAILLRHGNMFSNQQWSAILQQTLLPAIQAGAVNDTSPVVRITSEAPSVSSVDFLVEPWPLPPSPDDASLKLFETAMKSESKRTLGPAELMLEASFTDLRHGGDGDLRKAYLLARKGESSAKTIEQPFPDSWLATTAPMALGLLTDVCSEIAFNRGSECREIMWPLISNQYKLWCLGKHKSGANQDGNWSPCEALVRVSCGEVHRLACRLCNAVEYLGQRDLTTWASAILELQSDMVSDSIDIENVARKRLLRLRKEMLGKRKSLSSDDEKTAVGSPSRPVKTPFGSGHLKETRVDRYTGCSPVKVKVIELSFGAILFNPERPARTPTSPSTNAHERSNDMDDSFRQDSSHGQVRATYWDEIVPVLKIRCIAAHCVHQSLQSLVDRLILLVPKSVVSSLLCTLNSCRFTSEAVLLDEHVAMAFKEALLSDWGEDDVDEVQEAIESAARLSHLHGSAMFFLNQEAGATKSIISMLSTLYSGSAGNNSGMKAEAWDRESFAELHLFAVLKDVLDKFLESEEKDGHLIDPNVWRNASESGGKVALYCTSFAGVVVEILSIIRAMKPEQFAIHKEEIFPRLCTLIRVQSDEIRELVREVLMEQVAPILGVPPSNGDSTQQFTPSISASRSWG